MRADARSSAGQVFNNGLVGTVDKNLAPTGLPPKAAQLVDLSGAGALGEKQNFG